MTNYLAEAWGYFRYIVDYGITHAGEIAVNLISESLKFGFILVLIFFKQVAIATKTLFKKLFGADEFSSLYGRWHVYRISSRTTPDLERNVIDTEVTVRRRWVSRFPKCIFYTRHTGGQSKSRGYCRLVGTNLFFHFSNGRTSEGSFADFTYWLVNLGYEKFKETKYGFVLGVLSSGDVYCADVIFSRMAITPDQIYGVLTKTKLAC